MPYGFAPKKWTVNKVRPSDLKELMTEISTKQQLLIRMNGGYLFELPSIGFIRFSLFHGLDTPKN